MSYDIEYEPVHNRHELQYRSIVTRDKPVQDTGTVWGSACPYVTAGGHSDQERSIQKRTGGQAPLTTS